MADETTMEKSEQRGVKPSPSPPPPLSDEKLDKNKGEVHDKQRMTSRPRAVGSKKALDEGLLRLEAQGISLLEEIHEQGFGSLLTALKMIRSTIEIAFQPTITGQAIDTKVSTIKRRSQDLPEELSAVDDPVRRNTRKRRRSSAQARVEEEALYGREEHFSTSDGLESAALEQARMPPSESPSGLPLELQKDHIQQLEQVILGQAAQILESRPAELRGQVTELAEEMVLLRAALNSLLSSQPLQEATAEELALIPKYPGRPADSFEWYEEHWLPLMRKRRVWQHQVRARDARFYETLKQRCRRAGMKVWELLPPKPGQSGPTTK